MPLILLVRHAENEYSRTGRLAGRLEGVHLNKRGLEQAQTLAHSLARLPLAVVYSSPLERALETAAPIAEARGLEVIPHPGLMEIDYGEWQGKSLKGLRRTKLWKTVQNSPSWMRFPGGETLVEAQYRVSQAVREIAAQYGEKDWVVCVSHADPIKLTVAHFLGMPLDTYQRLTIGLASVTLLYLDQQMARVLSVNFDVSLFDHYQKAV
ncbi:MAG: histidine phosphatase family protein [Chloroflexota bacterium]